MAKNANPKKEETLNEKLAKAYAPWTKTGKEKTKKKA